MDNRNQDRSQLSIFRFQSSNVPRRVFANGLQRVSLHIEIRKIAPNGWNNEDLSAQELNSLRLIRADGLPMGNWSTFSERGRTDILLGENTSFQAGFSEEVASEVEEGAVSPASFQLVTRFLSSNRVLTTSFVAEIKLDDNDEVTRIRIEQSIFCEAVRPQHVEAQNLVTNFVTKFDEKMRATDGNAAHWWSVSVLYAQFPTTAPLILRDANFGVPSGGLHFGNRISNLTNINAHWRRIMDALSPTDTTFITTHDIRRGFASERAAAKDIRLISGALWPIRLILYYDDRLNIRFEPSPITYTFMDHFGTIHRYRVEAEIYGRFDIFDAHPIHN